MIVAGALYLIGLALTLSSEPLRTYYLPVSYLWLLLCFGVVGMFILSGADIADVLGISGLGDRFTYTYRFAEMAQFKGASIFSLGFDLITLLVQQFTANENVYFLAIFFATLILMHILVNYMYLPQEWAIVYFIYLNYFAFFYATMVTIRHGLAISIICCALKFFLQKKYKTTVVIIICATLIHSVTGFGFLIFFSLHRLATVPNLLICAIGLFGGAVLGINRFIADRFFAAADLVPERLMRLSDDPYFSKIYVHGIYRMDFLLFSMIPAVVYYILVAKILNTSDKNMDQMARLVKIYLLLLMPFSFFSYLPFSDRFCLTAWMFLPVVVLWPLLQLNDATGIQQWPIRIAMMTAVLVPNAAAYGATLFSISRHVFG
jgi:hypothetical protein